MSTIFTNLISGRFCSATETIEYTLTQPQSQTVKAVIDSFIAHNATDDTQTISVYLTGSGETFSDSNAVIKSEPVRPGESKIIYQLSGQVIEDGGSIVAACSNSNSVMIRCSGRVISS